MSIIGSDIIFTLLKLENPPSPTDLVLHLSSSNFFPKNFNPEEFYKDELKLVGIAEPKTLRNTLEKFINKDIHIEHSGNNNLDFWCYDEQIGTFEIKHFEEKTTEFDKNDWIESYQYLLREYSDQRQENDREGILNNQFLNKLEKFIEQERFKNEQKTDFFKSDSNKLYSLREKSDLLDKFENIKDQYLDELRKT